MTALAYILFGSSCGHVKPAVDRAGSMNGENFEHVMEFVVGRFRKWPPGAKVKDCENGTRCEKY